MLVVRHPPGHSAARRWVIERIFGEFLQAQFRCEVDASLHAVEICLPNDDYRIVIADRFFAHPQACWLDPSTLPSMPIQLADFSDDPLASCLINPRLPVLYGSPTPSGWWIDRRPGVVELGIDVLGGAFIMLSRYEEVVVKARDAYGRFPASASIAARAGFLERPLVDEYVELLAQLLVQCGWLRPPLRRMQPPVNIGHDVDAPFKYLFCNAILFARTELAARLRRKETGSVVASFRTWRQVRGGDASADPYNTFDFLMDESEARGWQSAFYFIADRPAGWRDGLYQIDHPVLAELMRKIVRRNHRIALHGSFNSYNSFAQLQRERRRLERACAPAGRTGPIDEIRQHYLRFDAETTPALWSQVGFRLDSSLSFAQHAGFRCGTSRRFRLFDLQANEDLDVDEQPLIAMDTSLIDYQRLPWPALIDRIGLLASRAIRYGGCMTLLWHNSQLHSAAHRERYREVLDAIRHASLGNS